MVKDIKDMTDEELAKLVKAHFLQYDNDRDAELNFLCEHPNRDMWDDEQKAEYDELMQMVRTGRTFYKEILNEVARRAHKSDETVNSEDSKEGRERTFVVDVHWDVHKSYEVKAKSKAAAQKQIDDLVDSGEVCVWTDGFEAGEVEEIRVSGEENEEGEIEYY